METNRLISDTIVAMAHSSQIGDDEVNFIGKIDFETKVNKIAIFFEQIEKLVSSYSQMREVCSQALYDVDTQSYYIESQSNETETETEAPAKLDFLAEYLKCCGIDANDIPKFTINTNSIQEQNNLNELGSQTDVETAIPAHITDNPNWSGNVDPRKVRIAIIT